MSNISQKMKYYQSHSRKSRHGNDDKFHNLEIETYPVATAENTKALNTANEPFTILNSFAGNF